MKLRMRPEAEEESDEEAATEELAARPAGGYRIAGDLEVRSKEIEQELVQTKARLHEMEREVFAARKVVRRRKVATAASQGGLGATLMTVIAFTLYGLNVVVSPPVLLGLVLIGFVFGALLGMRWDRDDDFPSAPPPRMH